MNKSEVTQLFKKIKIRYPAFMLPTDTDSAREMVEEWLSDLQDVPLETALLNLRDYAKHPDHKFAPHPGALSVEREKVNDRYSELMKEYGQQIVSSVEQMKATAVPISEEQRRKVRELFEK